MARYEGGNQMLAINRPASTTVRVERRKGGIVGSNEVRLQGSEQLFVAMSTDSRAKEVVLLLFFVCFRAVTCTAPLRRLVLVSE